MIIDNKYGYAAIQNFAAQVKNLTSKDLSLLEANFNNDQSDDFYLGLLSGYANAYALTQKNLRASEYEKIIAFLADKIAQKGL